MNKYGDNDILDYTMFTLQIIGFALILGLVMSFIVIILPDEKPLKCVRSEKVKDVQPLVHNTEAHSWVSYYVTYEDGSSREMGTNFGVPAKGQYFCREEAR